MLGTPPNVSLLVPHHGALPTLWLLWLYLFLSLGVTKSHQALQLRSPLFVVDVKCEKTGRRNHHVHGTSPDVCFSLGLTRAMFSGKGPPACVCFVGHVDGCLASCDRVTGGVWECRSSGSRVGVGLS